MKYFITFILSFVIFYIDFISPKELTGICERDLPHCDTHLKEGELCLISVYDIKPTQRHYGKAYSENYYQKKMTGNYPWQKKYCDFTFPALIGTKHHKGFYLLDGHHRAIEAYFYAERKQTPMYIVLKIERNLNVENQDFKDFWQWMIHNNYAYSDILFHPNYDSYFPHSLGEMENDPYRSLTGFMRDKKSGCFNDSTVYYFEFFWGQFLKNNSHIVLSQFSDLHHIEGYINAIKQSGLCHSPQASHLPGYISKE